MNASSSEWTGSLKFSTISAYVNQTVRCIGGTGCCKRDVGQGRGLAAMARGETRRTFDGQGAAEGMAEGRAEAVVDGQRNWGGFSSVSVAQDHIFTMGDGPDSSYVYALNEKDGKQVWAAKVGRTEEAAVIRGRGARRRWIAISWWRSDSMAIWFALS